MQNRVSRGDVVAELVEADQQGLEKFKQNALIYSIVDLAQCAAIYYMITEGTQPGQVTGYLTEFLIVLAPFSLLKLVLLYCTASSRSLSKSEWYKIVLLLICSVAIFVIWIRGFTAHGDMVLVVQENERLAPREVNVRVM